MKARIIKRVLSTALVVSLIMASSLVTLASTSSSSVSGNTASSGGSTGGGTTASAPAIEYKETSSVAGVTTSVGGVYIFNRDVAGAVTTPLADISTAFGLDGAKERPFVKMTDMDNKKSYLAYGCMVNAASAFGGTIYGTMNVEFGKMASGKYELLPGTGAINAVFSVPAGVQGKNIAAICVKEGGLVSIIRDADTDPRTATFALPGGACALGFIAY